MSQPRAEKPSQEQRTAQKPKWLRPALGALIILIMLIGILVLRQMGRPLTEADVRPIEGEPLTQGQVRPLDPGDSLAAGNPSGFTDGSNLTGQPATQPAPRPEEPRMPDDVARYLEHIRRVETERQRLMGDFSKLYAIYLAANIQRDWDPSNPDPSHDTPNNPEKVRDGINEITRDWANLSRLFLTASPPRECQSLYQSYDKMLAETVSVFLALTDIARTLGDVQKSRESLDKAFRLRQEVRPNLTSFARSANQEKDAIYRKYGQKPDFDIITDVDSGMSLLQGIR